jgi:hypothetical protein
MARRAVVIQAMETARNATAVIVTAVVFTNP